MRTISVRQFQQHFHKELKELPFVVTRNGIEVFKVIALKEDLPDFGSPVCPHGFNLKVSKCKQGCV